MPTRALPPVRARTTIVPPPLPAAFVRRDRLRALLDAGVDEASVTLVRAHAGRGKTVMLADWARASPTGTTAWVSVDPAANHPGHLWASVAEAVARCVPPPLAGELRGLAEAGPGRPVAPRDLIDVLDRLPHEVRLVLDDVHELTSPDVLDELGTVLRYRPDRLRLALSARAEPRLPLARLRLQGHLADIRDAQLAFSPDETTRLVTRSGIPAHDDEIERLHRATAGWAAGLRMVTDAARRSDLGSALGTLAAEEGPAATSLSGDLLARLGDEDRAFLRSISIADPVPTALAADLSGRRDAGPVLARLADLGLVTESPEPGRHRIQPLLRRHLRTVLERRHPARAADLHRRAARWYASADRPAEALAHAGRAGDPDAVADLTRDWAVPLILAGDHEALRAALRGLGPTAVAADPALRAAAHTLDPGTPATPNDPAPDDRAAGVADLRELRAQLGAADTDGIVDAPGDDHVRRARAAAADVLDAACAGADHLLAAGDRPAARVELEDALARSRSRSYLYLEMRCAALLTVADLADEDTTAMTRHAATTVAAADTGGWRGSVSSVQAHAVLAHASLLRADPGRARRHATDGLEAAGDAPYPALRLQLHAVHGAADADEGRLAEGLGEIQRARTAFADRPLPGAQATMVAVLEHEAAVTAGRGPHARAVRRWLTGRVGTTGDLLLMAARAQEATAAGPSLRAIVDGTVPTLLVSSEIEARLERIGDGQAGGDPAGARISLRHALERGAPLGLVRSFAHSPRAVRTLLAHQVGSFGATDDFAREALAVRPPGHRAGPVDALSDRESAVLRLLPSLATMGEIAGELEVSVNTVKTQVGAVYAKLGVGDRRSAVVAAYDAGLLSPVEQRG